MSVQAIAWALGERLGSPTAKVLVLCLANYADERWECFPSQKRIAAETELDQRTIRIWLSKLEAEGYIARKQRRRDDGYRTTDLIRLIHISEERKTIKEAKEAKNLKGYGKFSAEKLSAENSSAELESNLSGISMSNTCIQIPGKEPSIKPLEKSSSSPPSSKDREEEEKFYLLLKNWPEPERPKSQFAAKAVFLKLNRDDQIAALKHAEQYRRNAKAQGHIGYLIPYLKQLLFCDFRDGPQLTAEGRFRIDPSRSEWSAWLEFIEKSVSARARENTTKQGFLLTNTRFPPPAVPMQGFH